MFLLLKMALCRQGEKPPLKLKKNSNATKGTLFSILESGATNEMCHAVTSCHYKVWVPIVTTMMVTLGLLGFNASATDRVISRRWNDDDEISFLVEETGVPGGNHRPTASNWRNFSHIQSLSSPGLNLGCSGMRQSEPHKGGAKF